VAAAAALWALGAVIASDLSAIGVDPLELIEVRTWITAAGLGLLTLRRHAKRPARRLPLAHTIAFGVAVANAAFFLAIERLPVAVAIVQNLAPGIVAVCALLAIRRAPTARTTAALLMALVGVALVAGFPGPTLASIDLLGVGIGLLTAAGVAAFSILGERSANTYGAIGSMARAFAIASLAWIALQLPQGVPQLLTATEHLPAVLLVSVLGTLLPFVLFSWGVARVQAQAAVVGVSLEPVFPRRDGLDLARATAVGPPTRRRSHRHRRRDLHTTEPHDHQDNPTQPTHPRPTTS
jgi:drug/metabolite transporter, DME family